MSKANERVAILSILCKLAVDLEWIDRNLVVDLANLKGSEYEAWPDRALEAYEAYRAKHDATTARTACELGVGTGQRIGDCSKVIWNDFDGEFMRVVQDKAGQKIWIYCPKRLQSYLAPLP